MCQRKKPFQSSIHKHNHLVFSFYRNLCMASWTPWSIEILNENLPTSAKRLQLGHVWSFQKDSDPTLKFKQKWLNDHRIKLLTCSSQSLDLNLSGVSWRRVHKRCPWRMWRDFILRRGLRLLALYHALQKTNCSYVCKGRRHKVLNAQIITVTCFC